MTNIEFRYLINCRHRRNVASSESVTRGNVQTILGRQRCSFTQAPQFLISAHCAFAVNTSCAQGRFGVSGRA